MWKKDYVPTDTRGIYCTKESSMCDLISSNYNLQNVLGIKFHTITLTIKNFMRMCLHVGKMEYCEGKLTILMTCTQFAII